MENKNEFNINFFYVVIVAIVAIVALVVLVSDSNNQTQIYPAFGGGNVAGHAFGGSQWCMNVFQWCILDWGHSLEYCMNHYEQCEIMNDHFHEVLQRTR